MSWVGARSSQKAHRQGLHAVSFFPGLSIAIAIISVVIVVSFSIIVINLPIWPEQPQQQYDENTERVAGMRRLVEDDGSWIRVGR